MTDRYRRDVEGQFGQTMSREHLADAIAEPLEPSESGECCRRKQTAKTLSHERC